MLFFLIITYLVARSTRRKDSFVIVTTGNSGITGEFGKRKAGHLSRLLLYAISLISRGAAVFYASTLHDFKLDLFSKIEVYNRTHLTV